MKHKRALFYRVSNGYRRQYSFILRKYIPHATKLFHRAQTFSSSEPYSYTHFSSYTTNSHTLSPQITKTPIIIIGGGPTGLYLSILLSQYKIPHTLLEARSKQEIAIHPQAHYLNLRTMELLKHTTPNVYQTVMDTMANVQHWEGFTFSHSVMGRQFARVVHPVKNLKIGQDGNGYLVTSSTTTVNGNEQTNDDDSDIISNQHNLQSSILEQHRHRCSVSNPGHLAQNKFSTILLQEASTMISNHNHHNHTSSLSSESTSQILHGHSVSSVIEQDTDNSSENTSTPFNFTVRTNTGLTFQSQYVIVAEGAKSQTRQHFTKDIPNPTIYFTMPQYAGSTNTITTTTDRTNSSSEIQHLINIHFKTSTSLSRKLQSKVDAIGMLHFVFHPQVVGAYVCHDIQEGEWVLQIPYFPPFQSVQHHFSEDKVRNMVLSGLLDNDFVDSSDLKIVSIKTWVMSASVAKSFLLGKSRRMILAGDAAHVFPPAGGFGMNTGLQDVHNLAWRLSLLHQHNNRNQCEESKTTSKVDNTRAYHDLLLQPYEMERKQIALQNASLSLRNYERTLNIAKACYLNANHPTYLKKTMEFPPLSYVPLSVRQELFHNAVQFAMSPLSNLAQEGNVFGDSIVRNIRSILQQGGGLPLLFPSYEIGFRYLSLGKNLNSKYDDLSADTAGYIPSLSIGRRLPHILLQMASLYREDCHDGKEKRLVTDLYRLNKNNDDTKDKQDLSIASLTDIESQVNGRWEYPQSASFTILVMNTSTENSTEISELSQSLQDVSTPSWIRFSIFEICSNFNMATLRSEHGKPNSSESNNSRVVSVGVLVDINKDFERLLSRETNNHEGFVALVVRPDGHILNIVYSIQALLQKISNVKEMC